MNEMREMLAALDEGTADYDPDHETVRDYERFEDARLDFADRAEDYMRRAVQILDNDNQLNDDLAASIGTRTPLSLLWLAIAILLGASILLAIWLGSVAHSAAVTVYLPMPLPSQCLDGRVP